MAAPTWAIVLFSLISSATAQCIVPNTNITVEENKRYEDCKLSCSCSYGRLACVSACPPSIQLPSQDCPNPQWRVPDGECCEQIYCDPCPAGRWGLGCKKKCGQCAAETPRCNITNGECPRRSPGCMPGYFGRLCTDSCPEGKFGPSCFRSCGHCAGGHSQCNVTSGACMGSGPRCEPGWSGLMCERQCDEGYYGPDCISRCGACLSGQCNRKSGRCKKDVPLCKIGYTGDKCTEVCRPGTFGPECQWDCGGCKAGPTTCKPQNGECPEGTPRCEVGYMGVACKVCPKGTWGAECGQNCSEHCARGRLECDVRDGTCLGGCRDGFLGDRCDALETGSPDLATVIGLAVGGGVLLLLGVSACTLFYLYRHRPRSKLTRECSYLTPMSQNGGVTKEAVSRTATYEVPTPATGANETGYIPPALTRPSPGRSTSRDGNEFSMYETLLPDSDWCVTADTLDRSSTFAIQGNFGSTQLAQWRCTKHDNYTIPVGLRRFTGNGSDERKDLVNRELEKLRSLERCVFTLTALGLSTHPISGELWLLVEWTEYGNLWEYLRLPRPADQASIDLSEDTLLKFCLDAALAMVHLSSHKITPVDLLAKTILLDKNLDAKLTGFVHFEEEEHKEVDGVDIPESSRWSSVETLLHKNSSTASDVWSFGVLLWEVFSLGETPYADMSLKELVGELQSGCRLGHPPKAPTTVYVLMTECWQAEPKLRPSFPEIVRRLRDTSTDTQYCPMTMGDLTYIAVN